MAPKGSFDSLHSKKEYIDEEMREGRRKY